MLKIHQELHGYFKLKQHLGHSFSSTTLRQLYIK